MKSDALNLAGAPTQARSEKAARAGSEARLRSLVLSLAVVAGPPLLLVCCYRLLFTGLVSAEALDFAQIGRNLSQGRGFTTGILRPLALAYGGDPLRQPDLFHAPLYPLLLAFAFGAFGAKDSVAAGVSGLFYLLTIPLIYQLGKRVFTPTIGLLTALTCLLNARLLEYATSGLPITLSVFLLTALFLALYEAAQAQGSLETPETALPKSKIVLCGLLTGLLYLTDSLFLWIAPVILIALLWLYPKNRTQAARWFLVPFVALALPWMIRNARLTGNPFFALRGLELWMNTPNAYPGSLAYRLMPDELIARPELFHDILFKILLGISQLVQSLPAVTANWALAFFLPSLFFRFTDRPANTLRNALLGCFAALSCGMLFFQVQMPLFIVLIPTALLFAFAYMLFLAQQAQMKRGAKALAAALVGFAVIYPLVSDVALIGSKGEVKERSAAWELGKMSRPDEVVLTDQPAVVAWYAERPAVLAPATDARLKDVRQRFAQTRWLFVTPQAGSLSPEWQMLYSAFQQWNTAWVQARATNAPPPERLRIQGGEAPLLEALSGFVAVAPSGSAPPAAILATIPAEN